MPTAAGGGFFGAGIQRSAQTVNQAWEERPAFVDALFRPELLLERKRLRTQAASRVGSSQRLLRTDAGFFKAET